MRRVRVDPRPEWQKIVESQGLIFHTLEDGESPYWDESTYYQLSRREVDELERATYELDRMCLAAVEHVLEHNLLERFGIGPQFHDWLVKSWERDEQTIVGRFDLIYDGNTPPVMLEYNADTPTALLEASVIQWYWFQDQLAGRSSFASGLDQFNSLHEKLIEAWRRVGREISPKVHFTGVGVEESIEDYMTVTYLRDTAMQAGLATEQLEIGEIGWNAKLANFVDLTENAIAAAFKLYPWEWMLDEEFSKHLGSAGTRWLEPPWKIILSSKALLPLLFELFPKSPHILEAHDEMWCESFARKPLFSREGAGVSLVSGNQVIADSWDGETGPFIYQALRTLPSFDGQHIVFGSWMINGNACGIGIRESGGLITNNTSRFVPHLFDG